MDYNIFSTRIKEAREKKKMSQKDFADLIGVKQQTLSGYENNKMKPPIDVVHKIAETCETSIDWLCGLSDIEPEFKVKKYADIYRFLLALQETNKSFFEFTEVAHRNIKIPAISFDDADIDTFIEDLKKMKNLLDKSVIDKEVFDLWVEKTLKKADVPIKDNNCVLPF